MITLAEFLDDNTHRCYPFADVNELPTDIILDMHLLVTPNVTSESLIVSNVDITDSNIRITVSNNDNDLGTLVACALPGKDNTTVHCKLVNDEYRVIIEGSITFGLVESLRSKTGSYTAGKLFDGCIIPVTEWCTGLVINGVIYTGLVELEIGDGLKASVKDNKLTISAANFSVPDENRNEVITDEDIMRTVISTYGQPIITINGVAADSTGNIHITADDPLQINGGAGSITIVDTSRVLCEDAPIVAEDEISTKLEALFSNLSVLNERAGALEQSVTTIDTNLNVMSSQMAMLS